MFFSSFCFSGFSCLLIKKLNIFKLELRYQEANDKFQVKVNGEEEAMSELLNSLRDNVPKATGALYDYVNKYHEEHTGLDLKDASLKVRGRLQNGTEQASQKAMRQIGEVNTTLGRVARDATGTYQLCNDKAQNLYQELLDQEGQVNLQRLRNKALDSLTGVTEEYKTVVGHLIDEFIDSLKFTRF